MTVAIILTAIVIILAVPVLLYADKNLHGDDRAMQKVIDAGFEEKQVTLDNGTVLNYGEGGNEDLTPLLLIHGQGQEWQDYDYVLPELSKHFHVFAIDCHGHGKSSHDKSRYYCKEMTEDFISFIEDVIKKPCVISGHSSGGVLASAVAAQSPENIKALVIEDAPFFCVQPEEMAEKNAFVWSESFVMMHEYLLTDRKSSFNVYSFENSVLWKLFGNARFRMAKSCDKFEKKHPKEKLKIWYMPQSMLRGMYYSNDFDMDFSMNFYDDSWLRSTSQKEILMNIKCPTTYLKAKTSYMLDGKRFSNDDNINKKDAILCCANSENDAEMVTSLVKGCRRVTTPTSDHLIHLKYPKTFIDELVKYGNI